MKILALDLGQSSIGWVIRDTTYEGAEQFKKYGVFSFDKGVGEENGKEYSLAAKRTKYRSTRRLYQARKYKLWATLKKLKAADYCPISDKGLLEWTTYNKEMGLKRKYPVWDEEFQRWIKLDFNGDNLPDFESPYQLRKFLAENKLDFTIQSNRYMLGRALYHIAQHRAFKSSKKVKTDEDEKDTKDIGAEGKKKENLKKEFNKIGLEFEENKTVGQLLAEAEAFFKNRGYGRIRNELHPFVTRKMLQQEVEQIFQFQFGEEWLRKFEEIFGVQKVSMCSIFWQRPLRSQKSAVGKCTLEKNKYRCPVSHPQFEIFRAWSLINNIKYKTSTHEDYIPLTLEQKNKLYKEKFIRAEFFEFSTIREWLMKELNDKNIEINYPDNTKIEGSPTIYYLTKILGENWENVEIEHPPIERINRRKRIKYCSTKDYYTYEDIWHVAFQLDDEDEVERIAREKFKFTDEQVKEYMKLFKNMVVGYSRLSLKAIKNINYFLKKGLIYTDAVLLAKIPDILGEENYRNNEKEIIDSLKIIISENRKKKVILNITNNLISEYKINHYHERDYEYILQEDDIKRIEDECTNVLGKSNWEKLSKEEQQKYIGEVKREFQSFFQDKNRKYKKLPKLIDDLRDFLKKKFAFLDNKKLNKLYHPSAIDIYPKLTEKDKAEDGKLYLKSPKTGSWKNPMALRVLQELRRLINYLIQTDQIDEHTKIIVEIPRELNDANTRKAYEIWQKRREEENKEFAIAIAELIKNNNSLKANPDNNSDIDKFRMWYEQCFSEVSQEFTKDGPNELKTLKEKNKAKKDNNKEIKIWNENRYDFINTSLWFKIQKAKEKVLEKYRLWKEQEARCIYTGGIIKLSDLFNENTIDIEHTLPYSRSFDNSLANKTVCFREYNRKKKQNHLPAECPNYNEIIERIKPWEEKIENIKKHLEFWKNEAKKAIKKEHKDKCIIQKHLWTWELQYWKNKVERFHMEEIKSGFVNAQLVDTQIISKYAFHYLKSLFENVHVQKGSVTAEFASILGVRERYKPKNRDKHSHHVIDALILSVIPDSARLKSILEKNAKIEELYKENEVASNDQINTNNQRIELLKEEIKQLINECRIHKNTLHQAVSQIEENVLTLTPTRSKIFATARKKIKKGKLKGKIATGDVVRGQLHKDTFYGKIKLVERDENGKPLRDENGEWIWLKDNNGNEQYAFVQHVELRKVTEGKDPAKKLSNFIENIVDPEIKKILENKITKDGKINLRLFNDLIKEGNGGIIINNFGKKRKTIRIRHVRCFEKSKELLEVKEQSHKSKHEYKNKYYADNAENIYYALYEDENGKRTFEMLNLFNAVRIKETNIVTKIEDFFPTIKEVGRGKNKSVANLKAILYKNQKVIFYEKNIDELKDLNQTELSNRTYKVYALYGKTTGQVQFQHHLEARPDKNITDPNNPSKKLIGFSSIDFNNLQTRYLLSPLSFNFAIEGKDFIIQPDGEIKWLF